VLHVLERDFGITLPRWLQIDFARILRQEAERTGGELEGNRIRELFERSYSTCPISFASTATTSAATASTFTPS
jgi:2-isopropylmalate synthase